MKAKKRRLQKLDLLKTKEMIGFVWPVLICERVEARQAAERELPRLNDTTGMEACEARRRQQDYGGQDQLTSSQPRPALFSAKPVSRK